MKKSWLITICLLCVFLLQATGLGAQTDPFRLISISPYGVGSDKISTMRLEAAHYGKTLGLNNPCTYGFYVVNYDTKELEPAVNSCNFQQITLPSNGGRLDMEFCVFLPPGHYYITYYWIHTLGEEGPYIYSDFWVSDAKITEINSFSMKGTVPGQADAQGVIDNEAGTIMLNLPFYHPDLSNATVAYTTVNGGTIAVNGKPVTGTSFTADFTQPVTITVTSSNEQFTKDYTVSVVNGDGSDVYIEKFGINYYGLYGSDLGVIDNESGNIVHNLSYYHPELSNTTASCFVIANGSYSVNGTPISETYFTADFTQPVIIEATSPDGTVTKNYTVTVTNGDGSAAHLEGFKLNYYDDSWTPYTIEGEINEESGEVIFNFVGKPPYRGTYYGGEICISLSATTTITNYYDHSFPDPMNSWGYFNYEFFLFEEPYTFSITSPDGKVTKDYTFRINYPAIFCDEQYCEGFYDNRGFLEPITEPIPVSWFTEPHRIFANIFPLYYRLKDYQHEKILPVQIKVFLNNVNPDIFNPDILTSYQTLEDLFPSVPLFSFDGFQLEPGYYQVFLELELPDEEAGQDAFLPPERYLLGGITLTDIEPPLSDDATLSYIGVYMYPSSFPLDPAFDPQVMEYTVTVPNEVERANIYASPTHPRAKCIGGGTLAPLVVGKNVFEFIVTSESGEEQRTYTLTIYRSLSTSPFIVWKGGTDNNNWSASGNWVGGNAPTDQDAVIIPCNITDFPVLSNEKTVTEIYFEPGAQIKGQHYLTAKAFVQYDFSNPESRNRWNMLAMPLEEAYPGDFTFGGYPLTWVRMFSTKTDETLTKGEWITARKVDKPFTAGDGFVLWLNADDTRVDKGLHLLNGIHELPFFHHQAPDSPDKGKYDKVHPTHEYDGTGESIFHNPNNFDDKYPVDRSGNAWQLAGAEVSKTLDFGDSSEEEVNFALVGNPFMASLKLDKLSEKNEDVIKDSYHVWTKAGGIERYINFTSFGSTDLEIEDPIIAPLQGFIIEKKGTSNQIVLAFEEETMTTVEKQIGLRSSGGNENKLAIVARNPVAGVRTFIAKREGGQDSFGDSDARKIFNNINDVPEVYTLKPYKGGSIATAANVINSDEQLIPIGLATSYAGNITLSITGMDSYDAKLYLLDTETKKEIDLTILASYDYTVNYTPKKVNGQTVACEDRFFIRISKTVTGLEVIASEKVNVFAANGKIQVISSATNPIKEVSVFNLQGTLLYKEPSVATISHTVNRNLPAGVYIVRVVSEKGIDNVKIVISG